MNEMDKFLSGWEKVRQNTLATAEDMPEEHYNSVPFEGMWSFRKQLGHILTVGDVFTDSLRTGEFDASKFGVDNYAARSKPELVAALEGNFRLQKDQLASSPAGFWGEPRKSYDGSEKTAGELLQMLKEHELGHCNQLYAYLRAKGIAPPTTRKRAATKTQQK